MYNVWAHFSNNTLQGCTLACQSANFPCTHPEQLCGIPPFGDSCCNLSYFDWSSPGILANIVFMLAGGLLFLALLFLIEFRALDFIYNAFKYEPKKSFYNDEERDPIDGDVMAEKHRVRNMNYNQIRSNNLVVRNMTKIYGNFMAVNEICVGVDA